jgi:hypothetical protein
VEDVALVPEESSQVGSELGVVRADDRALLESGEMGGYIRDSFELT